MINEIQYTNIRRVLDELHKNPLLNDVTLEQVISYLVLFMGLYDLPNFYYTKEQIVEIKDYRGMLPCDLIGIHQVKDCKTNICLRSMTNTFIKDCKDYTFKTQGRVIFTSFKDGNVLISYKCIPTDEEGFPLLIDNPLFIKTLEQYIKKEVYTTLFDLGKITPAVLQHTEQQYYLLAGQLQSEFTIPSVSEMESIKNMLNKMICNNNEFYTGFQNLGDRERLKGY